MHGTLNSIVSRSIEKKGNWAEIVPMVLYLMRCTPNRSDGVSLFLLEHGWEHITPLQLLYKGWVQQSLGDVDLEEWVMENTERVQNLRDKAVVSYKTCSKEKWDVTSKPREFVPGYKVLLRKSGLNSKLTVTWLGPNVIVKKNSPLCYKIDTGSRRVNSVHIQLLKAYVEREEAATVKRVTTVLEPDSELDSMDHQYTEVAVSDKVDNPNRESDIQD